LGQRVQLGQQKDRSKLDDIMSQGSSKKSAKNSQHTVNGFNHRFGYEERFNVNMTPSPGKF